MKKNKKSFVLFLFVLIVCLGIGFWWIQRANENAQNRVEEMVNSLQNGPTSRGISLLEDEEGIFLAEDVEMEKIHELEEIMNTYNEEMHGLKSTILYRVDTTVLEQTLENNFTTLTSVKDRLSIQEKVNDLFLADVSAIKGSEVHDDLALKIGVSVNEVENVVTELNQLYDSNEQDNFWVSNVRTILNHAEQQAHDLEEIDDQIANLTNNGELRSDFSLETYDSLVERIERIENNETRQLYHDQLVSLSEEIEKLESDRIIEFLNLIDVWTIFPYRSEGYDLTIRSDGSGQLVYYGGEIQEIARVSILRKEDLFHLVLYDEDGQLVNDYYLRETDDSDEFWIVYLEGPEAVMGGGGLMNRRSAQFN